MCVLIVFKIDPCDVKTISSYHVFLKIQWPTCQPVPLASFKPRGPVRLALKLTCEGEGSSVNSYISNLCPFND